MHLLSQLLLCALLLAPSIAAKENPDYSQVKKEGISADSVSGHQSSDEASAKRSTSAREVVSRLMNRNNLDSDCWLCSYPCDNIYCCSDGHPQCCTIGGQCACCDS